MRKRNCNDSKHRALRGHLQRLVFASFLAALSIVFGKYLAIRGGDIMRFSFENLPLLLSGMLLGPAIGTMTAIVADLVGCVLVGYSINPLVTLGGAAIGLLGGVLYRWLSKSSLAIRVAVSVISSHVVGSVLIKTWGLAAFYDMPFYALLLWRLLNYVIVGAVECVVVYYVMSNKTIKHSLEKLR